MHIETKSILTRIHKTNEMDRYDWMIRNLKRNMVKPCKSRTASDGDTCRPYSVGKENRVQVYAFHQVLISKRVFEMNGAILVITATPLTQLWWLLQQWYSIHNFRNLASFNLSATLHICILYMVTHIWPYIIINR